MSAQDPEGTGRRGAATSSPPEVRPGPAGGMPTHAAGRPVTPPRERAWTAGRGRGGGRGCHLSEGLVQLRRRGQVFGVDLRFLLTVLRQLQLIRPHQDFVQLSHLEGRDAGVGFPLLQWGGASPPTPLPAPLWGRPAPPEGVWPPESKLTCRQRLQGRRGRRGPAPAPAPTPTGILRSEAGAGAPGVPPGSAGRPPDRRRRARRGGARLPTCARFGGRTSSAAAGRRMGLSSGRP